MAIRMTGLTSGLDTDTIIEALVSAQKMKTTKVKNKLTKSEWSEEIWKDINKKMYSFYTTELTKFKTQGNYVTKKATSSNDKVVTATAGNSAVSGSHSLAVKSLASTQTVTSGKIDANSGVKMLSDLGMDVGTVIKITGAKGKTTELEVTASTSISDFVSSCKSVGLNASFDTAQKRLFISSADSGAENGFSITTGTSKRAEANKAIGNLINQAVGTADEEYYDAYINAAKPILKKIQDAIDNGVPTDQKNAAIEILNCVRGYSTDAKKQETLAKYQITEEEYNAFKQAFEHGKSLDSATDKTMNDSMSDYLAGVMNATELKNNFNVVAAKNDSIVSKAELTDAFQKLSDLDATSYANLKTLDVNTATDQNYKDAGVTKEQLEAYNLLSNHIDMTAFDTQMDIYIKNEVDPGTKLPNGKSQLSVLGLDEIDSTGKTSANNITGTGGMSVKWASDAVIELDGAELTGTSNKFLVNGMTLDLASTTFNETTGKYDEISLTVSNDTDTAYKMVKDFVKKYNELLSDLNEKFGAASARGYDPLTDEQKEAMSDDEVEKWEKKIKDSLLRRDGTVDGLITALRSSLQINVEVDGKKYSLASFGIRTSSDYTEKGKLHIFGDEDDENYSTETNLLKKGLDENPEAVMKTLAAAGQQLYDALTKKMAKTSLSSALTFYNDKKMDDDQSAYKKKIKELEKKATELEDRYYKQFTAMESALTKMQNNTSMLFNYFGS